MERKLNVLLTGAAGTVGQEVLKSLFLNYHIYQVTVFDQQTEQTQALFKRYKNRIDVVYGNIQNKEDIAAACHNKDIVIHLAAIIPPLAEEQPELAYQVNVKGTQYLLDSLTQYSPKAFVFFSSSISVYGDRLKNNLINIGDELIPSFGDEYAKHKIEAEQVLKNSGLDWSIFRLSAIMGTRNHKVSGIMFHMPLDTCLEITTPEDTGRAFFKAIPKRKELLHKTYNLGGGPGCRITYYEFLKRSFENFGLGKLDFPEYSFAEKNFHCGYYEDGDELEQLLHFRRDNIDRFFQKQKDSIPVFQYFITRLFRAFIKRRLLKKSEPYLAHLHQHDTHKQRFFHQ